METTFIPYTATEILPAGNVLVLAPHPDDEVFGCGGAIMQHICQGNSVHVIIATDGGAAIEQPNPEDLLTYINTRQQESCQAAQILGYGQPEFWQIPDRSLETQTDLVIKIKQLIEAKNYSFIYIPSILEIHPDHYALAMSAIEAVCQIPQAVTLIMYEIGVPLFPNQLLNITPFIARLEQAMACFTSQLALNDYSTYLQGLNRYRCYTLPPQVQAAEAYYLIDNQTLTNLPARQFGYTRQTLALEQAYLHINQLQSLNQQQKSELLQIYHSRSWRWTAALRWLNRFVSKFLSPKITSHSPFQDKK